MKDEIKEKIKAYYVGNNIDENIDYITNLQEENERLKENAEHNDNVVDQVRWNKMLYKGRIDKAINQQVKELKWLDE